MLFPGKSRILLFITSVVFKKKQALHRICSLAFSQCLKVTVLCKQQTPANGFKPLGHFLFSYQHCQDRWFQDGLGPMVSSWTQTLFISGLPSQCGQHVHNNSSIIFPSQAATTMSKAEGKGGKQKGTSLSLPSQEKTSPQLTSHHVSSAAQVPGPFVQASHWQKRTRRQNWLGSDLISFLDRGTLLPKQNQGPVGK